MTVTGLVKTSLIDYPGKVACVLFVPGCNFDCFYCHNRQIIESVTDIIEPGYIMDFLNKRRGLLDGVVISGGEPTLQPDLIPFIEKIKGMGFEVKLDTNGTNPKIVRELLGRGLCDYYAVDYKAPKASYADICGGTASADTVLETINLLQESGADFEVRTTVIPQLSEKDLKEMAQELPSLKHYFLNLYRKPESYLPRDEKRINETPYTKAQLSLLADMIREWQPSAKG